jgi:proline-specific peptidase
MFYRSFGESKRVLIGLHGGPGANHKTLLPLASLAEGDLRVVLYDQLGCGGSDHPEDHSIYRIATAAEQLEGLRMALGLERMNLLGYSYGGFLALEYALKHQGQLDSLILSSTSASVPRTGAEMAKMRSELSQAMRDTIDTCEARGDLQDPEYLKCIDYLYHRRICILDPWPEEMNQLFKEWSQDIYKEMWGSNEFFITGNLRDWDVSAELASLRLRTLITVGRYDELPLPLAEQIHAGIRGSTLKVFEHSSHMAILEEPQEYLSTISEFLSRKNTVPGN